MFFYTKIPIHAVKPGDIIVAFGVSSIIADVVEKVGQDNGYLRTQAIGYCMFGDGHRPLRDGAVDQYYHPNAMVKVIR